MNERLPAAQNLPAVLIMRYRYTIKAVFIERRNRFTASVLLPDGSAAEAHVKNTGRLTDLLVSGNTVYLEPADDPKRKTAYDLIAAEKPGSGLFNIDSQAPNKVTAEWLADCGFDTVHPEYRYGNSRIDFRMKRGQEEFLLEVKGCTLERDGTGYFPDAPTDRGTRHLRELTGVLENGIHAGIAFVLQAENMREVLPNGDVDPAFASAFRDAVSAGVAVFFCPCRVTPDSLEIASVIPSPGTDESSWRLDTSVISADN